MNLHGTIVDLQERFKFSIDDLMELYINKKSREEIATTLGLSEHAVRYIGAGLQIKWAKSKREAYYARYKIDSELVQDAGNDIVKENDYLSNKLSLAQKALQRSRDETNQLRKAFRKDSRTQTLDEKVLNIVSNALPIKQKTTINMSIDLPLKRFEKYVSCIVLSDLHC